MAKQKAVFAKGCSENGISNEAIDEAFNAIAKFAEYGFNKSHAIAYSLISYQTAYLKAYYPNEFMAALLTEVSGKQDKTIEYINDCKSNNIKVMPPHVNKSICHPWKIYQMKRR
jgi:DNA polymerase-3 subunit alpha